MPFPSEDFPSQLHAGISHQVSNSTQTQAGPGPWKAFEWSSSRQCHQCPCLNNGDNGSSPGSAEQGQGCPGCRLWNSSKSQAARCPLCIAVFALVSFPGCTHIPPVFPVFPSPLPHTPPLRSFYMSVYPLCVELLAVHGHSYSSTSTALSSKLGEFPPTLDPAAPPLSHPHPFSPRQASPGLSAVAVAELTSRLLPSPFTATAHQAPFSVAQVITNIIHWRVRSCRHCTIYPNHGLERWVLLAQVIDEASEACSSCLVQRHNSLIQSQCL